MEQPGGVSQPENGCGNFVETQRTIARRKIQPADGRPPDYDKRLIVGGVGLCSQRRNRGQDGATNVEAVGLGICDEVSATRFYSGWQFVFFVTIEAQDVPIFQVMFKILEV